MRIFLFCLLITGFFLPANAQEIDFEGTLNSRGLLYSSSESPFWFHSNQRGRVDEISNVVGLLSVLARYQITDNAKFDIGIAALYSDGYQDELQFDESFFRFENKWLLASVGRRQREELYRGISASNENILWSLNARPLPGISLKIKEPVYFWKGAGLGFQASLEEFITDDDRYVRDTRVHHKSFHLVFNRIRNWEFTVGMHHFVQWGGHSPDFGKLPSGIEDYINVFSGIEGTDDVGGEEANALGNHLGSYVAGVKTSFYNYNLEIIYNHLFEDGSGRRLGNTPDGRYGIYVEDQEAGKWVDAFMYEFYYTKHQSSTSTTTDGADNYFNNSVYRSGWTYESRVLGVPFMFLDEDRFRIANNKFVAHHFGISGSILRNRPYRLMTSYRKNYGAKAGGQLGSDILSTYLDVNVLRNVFNLNVQVGADFSTLAAPNFGAGLQLTKSLF